MIRCCCDLINAYIQQTLTVDATTVSNAVVAAISVTQITVIPQDAHLFSGTVRQSIDPTGTVSDARLWEVIQQVQFSNILKQYRSGVFEQAAMCCSSAACCDATLCK
jgi:ABC-type transport system involved in cytochrome bd biosynthesis fused ATPase/permease subunit